MIRKRSLLEAPLKNFNIDKFQVFKSWVLLKKSVLNFSKGKFQFQIKSQQKYFTAEITSAFSNYHIFKLIHLGSHRASKALIFVDFGLHRADNNGRFHLDRNFIAIIRDPYSHFFAAFK